MDTYKINQGPYDAWYTRALHGSAAPDTAPVKPGDVYVNETMDEPYVAVGTSASTDWMALKPHYDSKYVYGYDDFLGYHDTSLWTKGGVGTPVAEVLTHGIGGQLRLTTSNVENDSTMIWMANQPMNIEEGLLVEARVNLAQILTTQFQFGLSDTIDIDDAGGNAVLFEYDSTNTNPTYWHTGTNIAGTIAVTKPTGSSVVALDSWVKLGIYVGTVLPAVNPKAHLYINDVLVHSINMPDPIYECSPTFNILTRTTAAKSVDIDYCGWRIPREQNS